MVHPYLVGGLEIRPSNFLKFIRCHKAGGEREMEQERWKTEEQVNQLCLANKTITRNFLRMFWQESDSCCTGKTRKVDKRRLQIKLKKLRQGSIH